MVDQHNKFSDADILELKPGHIPRSLPKGVLLNNSFSQGLEAYNDEELLLFKRLLLHHQTEYTQDIKALQNKNDLLHEYAKEESEDLTIDDKCELYQMQINNLSTIRHKTRYIGHINAALQRIQDGTYGVSPTTGKLISPARLFACPVAKEEAFQKKDSVLSICYRPDTKN